MNGILVTIAILEGTVAIIASILGCKSLCCGRTSQVDYLLALFISNLDMTSPGHPSVAAMLSDKGLYSISVNATFCHSDMEHFLSFNTTLETHTNSNIEEYGDEKPNEILLNVLLLTSSI